MKKQQIIVKFWIWVPRTVYYNMPCAQFFLKISLHPTRQPLKCDILVFLTRHPTTSRLKIFLTPCYAGLGIRSFQKNAMFLRSFIFFIQECDVLCILLCSLQNNAAFIAFFYILYKRTQRFLRSFTFFIKEHKRTLHSFWFHKSYKNDRISQKKNVKERCVLF